MVSLSWLPAIPVWFKGFPGRRADTAQSQPCPPDAAQFGCERRGAIEEMLLTHPEAFGSETAILWTYSQIGRF